MRTSSPPARPALPRRAVTAGKQKTFWLTTMLLPAAIWLLLIRYLPMFGIVMAFLDYRLPTRKMPFPTNLLHSEFVGLDNFQFLFTFLSYRIVSHMLKYCLVFILSLFTTCTCGFSFNCLRY